MVHVPSMKKQEKEVTSMRKQAGLVTSMRNAVSTVVIQLNLEGKNVYNLYKVYINH